MVAVSQLSQEHGDLLYTASQRRPADLCFSDLATCDVRDTKEIFSMIACFRLVEIKFYIEYIQAGQLRDKIVFNWTAGTCCVVVYTGGSHTSAIVIKHCSPMELGFSITKLIISLKLIFLV